MSASIWFQHEVAGDNYTHREARADGKGWLDVELAAHYLLTSIVDGILASISDRSEQPVLVVNGELGANGQ